MNGDLLARLRLVRSPGIGPVTFRQLLARFGSAEQALAAVPDLAQRGGGRAPVLFSEQAAKAEIDRVETIGARYLSLGQGLYPRALAELSDAPPLLTVMGNQTLLDKPLVAIVGARNASAAACRFARGLAHDLGREGVVVVSGLARGIDSAAHDGSLDSGTIAVIADVASRMQVLFFTHHARLVEIARAAVPSGLTVHELVGGPALAAASAAPA